jgi:hypothetical protein
MKSTTRTLLAGLCGAVVLLVGAQAALAASAPPIGWANAPGGVGAKDGRGVAALADGSAVISGTFQGDATFGTTALTSSASSDDAYIAKVSAAGSYVWAVKAGGTGSDGAYGIAALPDGSVLVTGYYAGTAMFGTTALTTTARYATFVAKLNADGSWAWATSSAGVDDNYPYAISTLPDGSAIVTGTFTGNSTTFGSTTLTSAGSYDVFVARINADGTWAWAQRAGTSSSDSGNAVSVFPDGSAVVAGNFSGPSLDFPGIAPLTNENINIVRPTAQAAFAAKITANGAWVWAAKSVGVQDLTGGIAAAADGSSFVTGQFHGPTVTFGSTTLTNTSGPSINDTFVAKLTADGTWAWATSAGGIGEDNGAAIAARADGTAVVTGYFQGSTRFGSTTLTGVYLNSFVASLDADGAWAWAIQGGGTVTGAYVLGTGLAVLPDGSIFASGYFSSPTADFGGITLTNPSSVGISAAFIVRYLDLPQAPAAPAATAGDGSAAVAVPPQGRGILAYEVTSSPGGRKCTITVPAASCTVGSLDNGTSYTFTATATNTSGTSPASARSNAVTPAKATRASKTPLTGRVRCVATTCITTGVVPAGVTRITQRATSRPKGRAATATCVIRRTAKRSTYSCTMRLTPGRWVIATTGRGKDVTASTFSRRVRTTAPIVEPVTG